MPSTIMNPLRILLLAALILTASFPGCLDKDSTDSEEINKPVAKIVSINPVNLTFGETVSFTGEGTTDKGYIIGYDWGSSLDGFLSDEKIFSISNLSIGNHTIFFKVQNDDKIWSDRIESNLTVNEVPEAPEVPNRPPEASILMPRQASSFDVGERVVIDCIASDPDGDLLEYLWILSGLEETINLTTEKSAEVEFSTIGNDLVLTLIVTDTEGLTSEDIVVINVVPANSPPIANITTPIAGASYSVSSSIEFNGLTSSDLDNDLLTYKWDLAEAGGSSYTASTESKFSLDLGEGNYSVTLTVEDPDGESNSVSHSFSVINLPPIASIDSDKTSVFTGEDIQFSGEDSYDPEGDALDYLWNFGDEQTSSLKSPAHSWEEAGTYTVTLTVEDGSGKVGTVNITIEVN